MNVPVAEVVGLDFTDAATQRTYGTIRRLEKTTRNHPALKTGFLPFAEDECGNAFLVAGDGRVLFWDHETDDVLCLADTWDAFRNGCHKPEPVTLDPAQVKSVWINPEFAKKMGIDVPADGYKKKP